ncbi:MAG: hypothetical protein ACREXR_01630 [Gammaproteobacteria bacterium]
MATTVTFTPQQVDALAAEIKKVQGMGSAETFCKNWDTAKQVLGLLQPIVSAVPGIGLFAGPAIGVVIAAGDAAKKAVCP